MRDKDYEAEFAPTRWYHWLAGAPFLVIGKVVELSIRAVCRYKGHRIIVEGYCNRCHNHIDH